MKKTILLLSSILILSTGSSGQSMAELFKALPLSYTPSLTYAAKEDLVNYGTYTIPGGDSIETMKCSYSVNNDNHLQLEYYYSTGQSGFIVIELKKFDRDKGEPLIVYSKYGGAYHAFDQHRLKTFEYSDGVLTLTKNEYLPEVIGTNSFLEPNLPDSLKANEINISTSYSLNNKNNDTIEYLINPQSHSLDSWVSTISFIFQWNGSSFVKSIETKD